MTRARTPRPHEIDDARRDERLLRALREGGRDPTWRARGLCQSVDPELFFPAPTEPADAAMELCRTCPVRGSCLAWALEVGDLHGVWGGTTARERRAMAVVWRGWQHRPVPESAPPLLGAVPGPHAVPGPRPPELAEVGPTMDRAELLRLVRAS